MWGIVKQFHLKGFIMFYMASYRYLDGELEFIDSRTLSHAFNGRYEII